MGVAAQQAWGAQASPKQAVAGTPQVIPATDPPVPDPAPSPKPDPKPERAKPQARATSPPPPPPPPPPPSPPSRRAPQHSSPLRTVAPPAPAPAPPIRPRAVPRKATPPAPVTRTRPRPRHQSVPKARRESRSVRPKAPRRARPRALRTARPRPSVDRKPSRRASAVLARTTLSLRGAPAPAATHAKPPLSRAAPVVLPLVGLGLLLLLGASLASARRVPWPKSLHTHRRDLAAVGFGAIAVALFWLNVTIFI
jgi:hypothetical protein